MDRKQYKITIVEVRQPQSGNLEDEIRWMCRCLDMDPKKDRIAFEIFLHLLNASRHSKGVRTIEITRDVGVTQAAVVYHMNAFMRSGVIVKKGREYYLRGGNLEQTIGEMETDMLRRLMMIRKVAEKIDEELFR